MEMEKDTLYRQGLDFFGRGEWSKAIACFTQLQANYPDDERIEQFLESARLRASMGEGLRRDVRASTRATWLRRFSWLVVLIIFAAIAAAIYFAYQTWVVPAQIENARLENIAQLRQTADIQIASGLYGDAIETYEAILAEEPADAQANAGIARAQQLEKLASLYAQVTTAMNNDDDDEAVRLLNEISAIDPNYRDASSLLSQIKATANLTEAYDRALSLYESSRWEEAVEAFEAIRSVAANFRTDEVKQYLFTSYVELADRQVAQADSIAAVEIADSYYQLALRVRPLDATIETARRTAQAFIDGAQAYQAKDWDTVIRKLSSVYEQNPDYFGGQVGQWLFEAFMTTGDAFMAQGDPFGARDQYTEALRFAPNDADRAEAQRRYTTADRLTTPTPTPRPEPTALPGGWVDPSWTRRPTGTPSPYPFEVIGQTYVPNTFTGDGCEYSGVAGRIYDMRGAPLTAETLGVRLTGITDVGVAAGSAKLFGESGWVVQFDVRAKIIQGYVQVYYKDKEASDLIPFTTHNSCFENLLLIDIQQTKPIPK